MNNKEKNVLVTGYNGGPVTAKEERLHENCIINIYAISSHS